MKKAPQNAEQTREVIKKFYARCGCECPLLGDFPVNGLMAQMFWALRLRSREARIQRLLLYRTKEVRGKSKETRRKIEAYFNRVLYGKEDVTLREVNKLGLRKVGAKLVELLSYYPGVYPYDQMTLREQAAIFGGPVPTHQYWRKTARSVLDLGGGRIKSPRLKSTQARLSYSLCQKGNRNRAKKPRQPN